MLKKFFTGFAAVLTAVSVIGNTAAVMAEGTEPPTGGAEKTQLITYNAPEGAEKSGTYTVKARPHDAAEEEPWQDIDVYRVQLMSYGTSWAGMAYFDCTGDIDVQVTVTGAGDGVDFFNDKDESGNRKGLLAKGSVMEWFPGKGVPNEPAEHDPTVSNMPIDTRVYPESYGIEPQYETGGDTISFTVKPGQRIVLDVNGDTKRNLAIWADYPIDIPTVEELQAENKTVTVLDASTDNAVNPDGYDTDVVYVKPGYYVVKNEDGSVNNWGGARVKSKQTWYFEGGAVYHGGLWLDFTEYASIIGRGLFYRPSGASMTVNDTKNTHIEGMMGLNHGFGDNGGYFINVANSKNVYVKNLKSIARHKWGDTMDIFCSSDVTVEGCYFRGNDDCIAIYGPRWAGNYWGETGNVRNIKVKNCVLMPDLARPIHFGTHGDSASPNGGRVIDNCRFEDIDILTYNKYAFNPRSSGRMPQSIRMDVSEGNTVTNIYFNNIRIRDYMANKVCELYLTTQDRYGTWSFPGKGINNVYFKDIDYKNIDPTHNGRIHGYTTSDGKDGIVQNVTFENLKINDEVITNAEQSQIAVGQNTKNIKFVEKGKYVYRPSVVPEDIWPEYYDYTQEEGVRAYVGETADTLEGDPSNVIDNNPDTYWSSVVSEHGYNWYGESGIPSNFVYNDKTKKWYNNWTGEEIETPVAQPDKKYTFISDEGIIIDLGKERQIDKFRITWQDPTLTHSYQIFVSKDGKDWSAGHHDEHGLGAINGTHYRAEYNISIKTVWCVNQYDPQSNQDWIRGRYVKIVPQAGSKLDIIKLEVMGDDKP